MCAYYHQNGFNHDGDDGGGGDDDSDDGGEGDGDGKLAPNYVRRLSSKWLLP